jgi:diguanylate cyclase (GGDEF)-like protein
MATYLPTASETNILIVDDNPDNLRLLARILGSQGYTIRKSLNGKMALQATYNQPPDLILLDINMPEMNGFEVCQQLKISKATAKIPIIFISALDRISEKVQAFELGGKDYITKPFQELEVLIRVKNQLLLYQQNQLLIAQNHILELEIQERLKMEAEIRLLSLTDELTGLYNRRGFFFLAGQQLKISQRTRISSCLLFIDLDGLKRVNDNLGHDVGDKMIIAAAEILKQNLRDSDIIARLGGDEFAIFIPICSSNMEELYARLNAGIDRFNQINNYPFQLSMSFGIKHDEVKDNNSLEHLLDEADKLMYQHKRTKQL